MDAKNLIRSGKLLEAREVLTAMVKSSPADWNSRTLLFQVLVFCGELDKAERHLNAIAGRDQDADTGVQVYKNALHAERQRREVYHEGRRPSFLPSTPPYTETYFAALDRLRDNDIREAADLFAGLESQLPVLSGTINGQKFTDFIDTDSVAGCFLETIVHENYVWFPLEAVKEISIPEPATLFDLIWITVRIATWEGLTLGCYLPVLYADSYLHADERVKLGRMTDWESLGGRFVKGMGQRVFATREKDVPLLEIREISFNRPEANP